MIAAGLLKEVENLYAHRNLNALQTVGYQEIFAFLDQKKSLEEAIAMIKQNTRRYAKRQMTWIRRKETNSRTINYASSDEELMAVWPN